MGLKGECLLYVADRWNSLQHRWDKRGEIWPPKVRGNKLASFQEAGVSGGGMVMAATKDVATEVSSGGNVNATFIGEYSIGMLPIREAGAECWGNRTIHGLKSLKDERVGGRGGGNTGG